MVTRCGMLEIQLGKEGVHKVQWQQSAQGSGLRRSCRVGTVFRVHEPSANTFTCHSHGHTQGTDRKVSSRENLEALEDLSGAGGSALRGPAEQAREARGRGGCTPCPAHAALRLRPGSRTRARSPSSLGLGCGDPAGGGRAAEVLGEEAEEPELLPPPLEKSMSATRAKKVKMATKSCPECDQQKENTTRGRGEAGSLLSREPRHVRLDPRVLGS
ncbi:uncharacterized protein LOC132004957 [Mustela nigripes]|uniref:uncharacterized protein LOC132004957 n=1 Tax=Mustela nigripes TaxID=77151 RepID=UPI002815A272|nr:uncharacterized protein LOC132004957 [Mustela nigripes]